MVKLRKIYKIVKFLEHMKKLHPGALWSFRLGGLLMFGFFGIFLVYGAVAGLSSKVQLNTAVVGTSVVLIIFYLVVVLVLTEVYARMTYNRWLYDITSTGVKMEKGIIWKKYSSIPYERVQNVEIHRGILARILGFSSMEIETAGSSSGAYYVGPRGGGRYHSEGHIPALDVKEAESIREYILKRISRRGM